MSCGIYKITSPSNKVYIGQSTNIEKMREVQMYGKNHASKIVIDLSNGVFYESASELAMIYNLNKYTLRSRLNGHLPNNTNFKYC